jgi:hypothetical protein
MIKTKFKNIKFFTLIFIGLVMALSFFHSEMGDCRLHEEHHHSHDYCLIIKGASAQHIAVKNVDIFKFTIIKEAFADSYDFRILPETESPMQGGSDNFVIPHHCGYLFISNRTFRI